MAAQRSKAQKARQPADSGVSDLLRKLPSVDSVLALPELTAWAEERGLSREFVGLAVNGFLDDVRAAVLGGGLDAQALSERLKDAANGVARAADAMVATHLQQVINATGVIVHTNLGRSPWPAAAAERVAELSRRYLNLEFDLGTGGRGQRAVAIERLVAQLLPGAAVAVVNNNAAAVLLVLNTLAPGKEVIVSRGQLVEIGGSFRIPDVMTKSQSILREVGTTNRTRIADFAAAIGSNTGAVMAVHPSNYRVVGFTEEAGLADLVELGEEHGVPVIEDLGSGCLVDLDELGIRDEPTVAERLATGVDLVTFSGDKLLGGPQAGFVVGKPEYVEQVRSNTLYRALRLDKATTLALEATLAAYVAGRLDEIPTVAMLRAPIDGLEERARALAGKLNDAATAAGSELEVVEVPSRVGGGAAPGRDLPSFAVAISGVAPDELMASLRAAETPVIGRIADDRVLLDVRTVLPDEDEALVAAVAAALTS